MPSSIAAFVVATVMGASGATLAATVITAAVVGGVVAAITGGDVLKGAIGGALTGVVGGTLGAGIASASTNAAQAGLTTAESSSLQVANATPGVTAGNLASQFGAGATAVPEVAAAATPTTSMLVQGGLQGASNMLKPVTQLVTGSTLTQPSPLDSPSQLSSGGGGFWGGMSPAEKLAVSASFLSPFVKDTSVEDAQVEKINQDISNTKADRNTNFSGVGVIPERTIQRTPLPTQGNANPYLLKLA